MTGFKPQTSGVVSNSSTNRATTSAARVFCYLILSVKRPMINILFKHSPFFKFCRTKMRPNLWTERGKISKQETEIKAEVKNEVEEVKQE